MIPRSLPVSLLSLWLLCATISGVFAQDTFDCRITLGDHKYDLTTLSGEHTVSRERDTPPTKFRDSVTFNLCDDLKSKEGVAEKDQCPAGTRACLTKTNIKESESDRITAVITLAKSSVDDLEYHAISSPAKGVSLTFKGPKYPDPRTSEPTPQSFNIRVLCDTETSDPTLQLYDGKDAWVEWKAPAGCSLGDPDAPPKTPEDDKKGSSPEEQQVGSGVGLFFLLLLLALLAYFGLGAYYNYSTYGATGADLIPHRDFWREVPYMLRDVVQHLCSTVRPRHTSSRGGYIAV